MISARGNAPLAPLSPLSAAPAVTKEEIEALYFHFVSLRDDGAAAPKGLGEVVNLT